MDDLIFKCEHCGQELSVDPSGAGSEIECPACLQPIVIPSPEPGEEPPPAASPIASSAAAQETRHFSVPQHQANAEPLITKPLKPLEVTAREGIHLRIKTFRRSDCVEVGKDHFDEKVSQFLDRIGEAHIVSVNAIGYAHQDLSSSAWVNDYGVIIVYRG